MQVVMLSLTFDPIPNLLMHRLLVIIMHIRPRPCDRFPAPITDELHRLDFRIRRFNVVWHDDKTAASARDKMATDGDSNDGDDDEGDDCSDNYGIHVLHKKRGIDSV